MSGMKCSTMIVMASALLMGLGSLLPRPAAHLAAEAPAVAAMAVAAR